MVAPAICDDGTVIITSEQGDMMRISSSGEVIFHLKEAVTQPFQHYHRPVIGEDGMIYDFLMGSPVGRLYAVDPQGAIYWYKDVGKEPYSPLAYTPSGLLVFRTYEWITAVDKESRERWKMNSPEPPWSPTAYYDGTIIWGDSSYLIWGVDDMGIPKFLFMTDFLTGGRAVTPISIAPDGRLVFRDEGGYISIVRSDKEDYHIRYRIGVETTFPLATYDEMLIFAYRVEGGADYTNVWLTDLNFEKKKERAFNIAGKPVLSHSLI